MKELKQLREDNHVLMLIVKAYIRENEMLKQDVEFLNASLDAEHAEKERWKSIAHKIDKLRRKSVQELRESARTLCDRVSRLGDLEKEKTAGVQTSGDEYGNNTDPHNVTVQEKER